MKTTQEIIESILAKNSGSVMTGREVYMEMEENEKGMFPGGVDAVNKSLCYLRTKGVVENGISEIVNGRTTLTWKLNAHIQKTEANKTQADIQDDADTKKVAPICAELPVISEAENFDLVDGEVEAATFHDMITQFSSGVNAFISGTNTLIAELDAAKAEIERLNGIIENINNLLSM